MVQKLAPHSARCACGGTCPRCRAEKKALQNLK
jgi:hypothetical protein